jgi:hypothetical protein
MRTARTSLSRAIVKQYLPAAREVTRGDKFYDMREVCGREMDPLALAALFAHLRFSPHTESVEDIGTEFAESFYVKNIKNVLEVGGSDAPFCRFFEAMTPADTAFYGFSNEHTALDTTRKFVEGIGDMHTDLPGWHPDKGFDLIISFAVHCSAEPNNKGKGIKGKVDYGNRSIISLLGRLSNNPNAILVASSYDFDMLALERSALEKEARVLLWEDFETARRKEIHQKFDWPGQFRELFGTASASLAILGRKT